MIQPEYFSWFDDSACIPIRARSVEAKSPQALIPAVPAVFDNLIIQQAVGFVKRYWTIAKLLKPGWQFIPTLTDEDFLPRVLKTGSGYEKNGTLD